MKPILTILLTLCLISCAKETIPVAFDYSKEYQFKNGFDPRTPAPLKIVGDLGSGIGWREYAVKDASGQDLKVYHSELEPYKNKK